MLGGCEDGLDLAQDEMAEALFRSPLLLWCLVLFIEAWSSPQILSGKGCHNGQFEGGQLVQAILTKGGLQLPKVLVMTQSWSRCTDMETFA